MSAGRPVEVVLPDGLVMRGERWGTGERRALLVHDDGADLDTLRSLAVRLAAVGFTAVAVDRIGHGASDGEADSGRLASDLRAATPELVGERGAYLVGIGGGAAGVLAMAPHARPTAVALVSPPSPAGLLDAVMRDDTSAAVVVFGRWDPDAGQVARDLVRRRAGPASLVALPGREQGALLLGGPLGPQVINHVVGYLRQVVPTHREVNR